jgi:hypothetical protein
MHRRLIPLALLLLGLPAWAATEPDDDECEALHGTYANMAQLLRQDYPKAAGVVWGSCSGDWQSALTVYHFIRPTTGPDAFIFEGARKPQCSGGGIVTRVVTLTITNKTADVTEISSGGLWSMRWFKWVAETILKEPTATAASFDDVFRHVPSRRCNPNDAFPG